MKRTAARLFAVMLTICLILSAAPQTGVTGLPAPSPAAAVEIHTLTEYSSGNYQYMLDDDGRAVVTKYTGAEAAVKIPDKFDGHTVIAIANGAFRGCRSLTKAAISNNVTEIGDLAFLNCSALVSANLPTALVKLGARSIGKTALTAVTIPKTLESSETEYDTGVYYDSYTFNNRNYGLLRGPFCGCEALKKVTFGEGVTRIPAYFLAGCVGIEEITIPDTVKTIGESAFKDCLALQTVVLPKGLLTIGKTAFMNGTALTDVTIPLSVTKIDENAFSYSDKMTVSGVKGSEAERFANARSFRFRDITKPCAGLMLAGGEEALTLEYGTVYQLRDLLDLTGMVVSAQYADGSSSQVTDYTVSGYNALKKGAQEITVTYGPYTAVFTVTVGETADVPGGDYAPGDVDGKDGVTPADARLALRASVKLEPDITEGSAAYKAADVNKDGKVGSDDARIILRVSVKLESL